MTISKNHKNKIFVLINKVDQEEIKPVGGVCD
jgi:hypothetical protein